ncbi:MAG TPA: glycosyltransferase [Planctomycetota bacterium]|nr:glycosyltransferase [Planctomycetota bacterium]
MKVLHLDSQKTWRGGENQAQLLIRGLQARHVEVAAVGRPDTPWVTRLSQSGCAVSVNDLRPTPPAVLQLRSVYRRFQPDILHCHDSGSVFTAALARTGMGRKRPRLVISRRVDFAINSAFKYNHLCDRVLAIGRAVTEVLEQGGVASEQIRIVPSGIDPHRFDKSLPHAEARLKLTPAPLATDLVALCVAALTDHKDHATLIAAWRKAVDRDPRLRLYLAGTGELEPALRKQVTDLNLGSHVHFLGWRDDIPDLLAAADLFTLTSHLEGLGTTLMDAQYCGLPIVATLAGGIPEVVEHGVTGLLAAPRDSAAVAAAILALAADPERRATMGKAGRLRAQQLFVCDRMVEQTLAVYQELL